jgi:hypothetical protein
MVFLVTKYNSTLLGLVPSMIEEAITTTIKRGQAIHALILLFEKAANSQFTSFIEGIVLLITEYLPEFKIITTNEKGHDIDIVQFDVTNDSFCLTQLLTELCPRTFSIGMH